LALLKSPAWELYREIALEKQKRATTEILKAGREKDVIGTYWIGAFQTVMEMLNIPRDQIDTLQEEEAS